MNATSLSRRVCGSPTLTQIPSLSVFIGFIGVKSSIFNIDIHDQLNTIDDGTSFEVMKRNEDVKAQYANAEKSVRSLIED